MYSRSRKIKCYKCSYIKSILINPELSDVYVNTDMFTFPDDKNAVETRKNVITFGIRVMEFINKQNKKN